MNQLPSTARAQLGLRLRELRHHLGLRAADVHRELDISPSKLSRMENSGRGVTRPDLMALLEIYRVELEERALLGKLRDLSREPSPYVSYQALLRPEELVLLEAVHECEVLRVQCGSLFPALLQTPAYADAALRSVRTNPHSIPAELELIEYQRSVFLREDGPEATFILDEAAFHRQVGGPDVMRAQLRSLLELPDRVSVLVLPFTASVRYGMQTSFVVADDMTCITGFRFIIERTELRVAQLIQVFDALAAHSTRPAQLPDIVEWAVANLQRERRRYWGSAA